MKTTAEMKIEISNARIREAKTTIMPDGTCELNFEIETATPAWVKNVGRTRRTHDICKPSFEVKKATQPKQNKSKNVSDAFALIEASKLSLEDEFLCHHEPKTVAEKEFKERLTYAIERGLRDFYCAKFAPSFANEEKTKIHYVAGETPAVGKSYDTWETMEKDIMTEWNGRFGTKSENIAFLGVVIKNLTEMGWSNDCAWHYICNDSRDLAHCKEIYDLFGDLTHLNKIVATDGDRDEYCAPAIFWLAGGSCNDCGNCSSLADMKLRNDCSAILENSVPWFVIDK